MTARSIVRWTLAVVVAIDVVVGCWWMLRSEATRPRMSNSAVRTAATSPETAAVLERAREARRPPVAAPAPEPIPAWAPVAPSTTTATLVVDVGVAGAQVVATASDRTPRFATADEKGFARIESPMPSGLVDVVVSATGRATRRWSSLRLEPGLTTIKIPLTPGVACEGVALEVDGAPIVGARVLVGDGVDHPAEATSAWDGRFRIDGVPVGANVRVAAPLHQDELVYPPADPMTRVEVRLKPAGRICGTVCGPSGARIEGAVVSANREGRAREGSTYRVAVTDAFGLYVIDGVPFGAWSVRASSPSFADAPTERGIVFDDARRDARRDFALQRPGRLDVRVRDADGGPVANATICVDLPGTHSDMSADADGQATFRLDAPGKWHVSATASSGATGAADVDAAEGATIAIDVRLEPLFALVGVVVDDRGHVVPRADVTVYVRAARRRLTSRSDGTFRIEVPGEVPVQVSASASMHEFSETQTATAPCDDVRLHLTRFGRAAVRLKFPAGDAGAGRLEILFRRESDHATSWTTGDRAAGLVTAWLAPGEWRAYVRADRCAQTSCDVQVVAGEEMPPVEVTPAAGLTLSGRVVDSQGRPIPRARVSFDTGDATTDADGRFVIAHLAAGVATAEVCAAGFLDGSVTTEPTTSLVVTLRRGGLIRGKVHDAAGAAASHVEIAIVDLDHPNEVEHTRASVDERGGFARRLPPGHWRVRVGRDEKILAERDVETREGEETPCEVVVGR